ncbi:MAG: cysteine desulfurase NifS [Chthoniobacterales bacterium]|nr:cysteine desulfurase NifS [Chthoniobacterales bacterium]
MIVPEKIIYLDHNATTPLDPAVLEEMLPFLTTYYGNPSSAYRFGAQVRSAIDLARERVAMLLGCEPGEIIFTSCGTESNNTAIRSALQLDPKRQHIVTTAVEHSAILRLCGELAKRGSTVTYVPVDSDGNLDLDELERAVTSETAIISAMWANNESGVLFPIEKIAEIARRKRVIFHCDAVQAAGKLPISLRHSTINFLSLSAHKLYGPKGVGALYLSRRAPFRPLLFGGSQENGRRAGTENVASIVGFGKAAERAVEALRTEPDRIRQMRDQFEAAIIAAIPDVTVNGNLKERLPNTSSLTFDGIQSGAALMMLDQSNLCCSAGSACHTGSLQASHVLRAMGLSEERARGSLRFSFGRFNTATEVGKAIAIVTATIAKMRRLNALSSNLPERKPVPAL